MFSFTYYKEIGSSHSNFMNHFTCEVQKLYFRLQLLKHQIIGLFIQAGNKKTSVYCTLFFVILSFGKFQFFSLLRCFHIHVDRVMRLNRIDKTVNCKNRLPPPPPVLPILLVPPPPSLWPYSGSCGSLLQRCVSGGCASECVYSCRICYSEQPVISCK